MDASELENTISNTSFKSLESLESLGSYKSVNDFPEGDLIETENCSEISNSHIMDLDLLTMSDRNIRMSNSVITDNRNLQFIPGLIKYGDIELPVIEYLSHGGYGYVFKYSDETALSEEATSQKVHSIAVKTFKTKKYILKRENYKKAKLFSEKFGTGAIIVLDDLFYRVIYIDSTGLIMETFDKEIILIELLNERMDRELCNTVNAKILTLNNNIKNEEVVCVAMELMDGPLSKLEFESVENSFAILQGIARLLQCLIDHQLSYSDLKIENLLYKCYGSKKMKIVLGDLGSIYKLNSEEHAACTYPPCDLVDDKSKYNTETAMVWQLGLVFIALLKDDRYYNFSYKHVKTFTPFLNDILDDIIKKYSLQNYKLRFEDIESGVIDLGILLKSMLDKESENRIRMEEIIYAKLL